MPAVGRVGSVIGATVVYIIGSDVASVTEGRLHRSPRVSHHEGGLIAMPFTDNS